MKRITKNILAACVAAALTPAVASAMDARNQGYLLDANGGIVPTASGLCVRDSDWTSARSAEPCDPVSRPVALAPVPQPVVAAAVPAPQPLAALAPMPVKAEMQKISFSADALFAFDKSVLKPEGKLMLDGLVTQLNGVTDDGIVLTGHTDRFGTSAYNQKLSERRATAVKEYLVAQGLPATSILAEGKGETQPDTKLGDCKGARSAKVIACLQPDRRVDVEMQGNKMVSQAL